MQTNGETTRKLTIFGFYGLGNFGDDLMGWMLAQKLMSTGNRCVLYSLADSPSDSLCTPDFMDDGILSARSIDEALEGSTGAILGGGGVLVSNADNKLRRFIRYFRKTEELIDEIQRRDIPLALTSIGGDGGKSLSELSNFARKAIGHASVITTRNPQDMDLLSTISRAKCYPDIVWSATDFCKVDRSTTRESTMRNPSRPIRIGLDLYASNMIGKGLFAFLAKLHAMKWRTSHFDLVSINSQHSKCSSFSAIGAALYGIAKENYQFSRFESDFEKIASLDILISSRLHVPIVALQLGVPTLSLFAEDKTRIFFEYNGLSHAFFDRSRVEELLSLLFSETKLHSWLERYKIPDVQSLRSGSLKHFQALHELFNT